jgi:tetratricopeptide (TPR) repeat protein
MKPVPESGSGAKKGKPRVVWIVAGVLGLSLLGFIAYCVLLPVSSDAPTAGNYLAPLGAGQTTTTNTTPADSVAPLAEAVRLRPEDADALNRLIDELLRQNRLAEAEAPCRQLADLIPTNAAAHVKLAEVLGITGRREEAGAQLTEALRLDPKDARAHQDFATFLMENKRFDEARAQLAEAVRLQPNYALAHNALGRLYRDGGHLARAQEQFAKVALLLPNSPRAHQDLGEICAQRGRFEKATKELEQAIQLSPTTNAYYDLALTFAVQGKPKEAAENYREALGLDTNFVAALNDLAWLLATTPQAELRNGVEAVQFAERARDLSGGKEARYWGTLDAAYAEAGRWDEALQAAHKALELAQAAGERELADAATQRLALYANRQPYRQ